MDTAALEELGLSKGEIHIYTTLLRLGTSKVGAIIEKTGMASSAVHNALNTLTEKGLVAHVKKSKIRFYQAAAPKQLLGFHDSKRTALQTIIPELEQIHVKSQERQEAEVFEGTKGIMAMLNLLIDQTKKGDEYLFFAVDAPNNEEAQKFFMQYDAKRQEKGLDIKGIVPKELESLFKHRKALKTKYSMHPIPSNISICRDKIALFSWGEKPVGFLIRSEQIASTYREYFHKLWKR